MHFPFISDKTASDDDRIMVLLKDKVSIVDLRDNLVDKADVEKRRYSRMQPSFAKLLFCET